MEAGTFGFERGVFGISQKLGSGNLLMEVKHITTTALGCILMIIPNSTASSLTAKATKPTDSALLAGHITANGIRAINSRRMPFRWLVISALLNPTDGGNSGRYSLQAEWHRADENSETKIMAYGFYYDLDLFSDFTYFLTDTNSWRPVRATGQALGGRVGRTAHDFQPMVRTRRGEFIRPPGTQRLDQQWPLPNRRPRASEQIGFANGHRFAATTKLDHFTDTEIGIYAENKIQWADKFRSVIALRGDLDYFDVTSLSTPANSGTSATLLPSPKLSLIFGPWNKTEVYAQGGFSFHSNDGRGATQTVEPVSADNPVPGIPVARIPGLIQTKGAEIGIRTLVVPHLQSTLSLWYLYSDSELQQDGDTGGTVASEQHSDRYGVEWANFYTPVEHLTFDFDLAESSARFTSVDGDDAAPGSSGGTRVPEAVGTVISSGVTLHDWNGFSASLRFGTLDRVI